MLNHGVALTSACRTKVRTDDLQSEQLPGSGWLRDGLEISVKCHVTEENLGQFHLKTGLAYVLVRMIVGPSPEKLGSGRPVGSGLTLPNNRKFSKY